MKKRIQLVAVFLVVLMFTVAGYANEKELIFPEIAALAFGAWVMEKSPWRGSALNLWLSPTLAAFTGFTILRLFPYSPFFMISGAFVLVALQLKLMRSAVLPSLSAAILPLVVHADSLFYPLSVCVLTGIIAIGHFLKGRAGQPDSPPKLLRMPVDEKMTWNDIRPGLIFWGKLLAGVLAVSAIALKSNLLFMIAPPLIVAFVEMSKPNGLLRRKSRAIIILLVLAAFSGVLWLHFIHHILHWPIWISAALTISTVFLIYHVMQLSFPPAAAIALLPTIIPAGNLWAYPWHVLFGSTAFLLISKFWFRQEEAPVRQEA